MTGSEITLRLSSGVTLSPVGTIFVAEGAMMELALIMAMIIVVPVILFLAVFVWYMNRRLGDAGKMVSAMRTALQTFVGKMTKP